MLADEQCPARGLGMNAHDGMHRWHHFIDLGLGQVRTPWIALLKLGVLGQVAVFGAGAFDRALQVPRQRFPGPGCWK